MPRPHTTLFMLISVDGKISTGDTDALDFDRDLPNIPGVRDGLHQYYDLEQQTDLFSLNTGRVMQKIGVNEKTDTPSPTPVSFVIIDNQPHLTISGLEYLCKKLVRLILVTSNPKHPAFSLKQENLSILLQSKDQDLSVIFEKLSQDFGIENLTIQSGSTLNAALLHAGLIDELSLVIAPLLVGGTMTPSLIGGESAHALAGLAQLVPLKLIEVKTLEQGYLHVRYQVVC